MASISLVVGCPSAVATDDDDAGTVEPPLRAHAYVEATAPILNPERGWYGWSNGLGTDDYASGRPAGRTLYYADVELAAFRAGPISEARLDDLEVAFGHARAAGVKLIVRFNYTGDAGAGTETFEDAPLAQILDHITQLGPSLTTHQDVIALVQAGFIGAWGEWHDSTAGNDRPAARAAVLEALLDHLPPGLQTAVRTPGFKEEAYGGPLASASAFDGSDAARVGHHNDCFLASETDVGTYPPDAIQAGKDFVAAEGRFLAVGGETCRVFEPRSLCPSALAEMEALHWSYLNRFWRPEVIQSWQDGGCYGEITDRLGYRFVLREARISEAVAPGGRLRVELDLENTGFAAPFNPRPVEVVFFDAASALVAAWDVDPRTLEPGLTSLAAEFRVPASSSPGVWTVALRLPDPGAALADRSEYAIRLAVDDVWDEATGRNVLGEVEVRATAGGEVDAAAASFAQLPVGE